MASKKQPGVKSGVTGGKKKAADDFAPAAPKAPKSKQDAPAAKPVKPAAPVSPEAEKLAALDDVKQKALDAAMAQVDGSLDEIKAAVSGVFPEGRSPRWILKRADELRREIQRHLDKAARRA